MITMDRMKMPPKLISMLAIIFASYELNIKH